MSQKKYSFDKDPTNSLAAKPIGRLLLEYSIPAIIASSIAAVYSIVSGIFIGHGVGPMALAGLAVAFPLFSLLGALCMLVAVGGATQCSIELGKGNNEAACRVLGNVTVLSLILSVMSSVGFLLVLDPVLVIFGASPDTLAHARDYLKVLLYGQPIGFLMLGLNSVMRASGYPAKAMVTAMVSVAASAVLTPLFIFVFHWGMFGAGLATILAQGVSAVWILIHFFRKDSVVHFQRGIFRLRWNVVRPILAIGTAPFLMNMCSCVVVVIINMQLKNYGGDLAIGAYGLIHRVLMLFAMVVMGLTSGMQPIIGFNFGAQRWDRVKETLRYGVLAGTVVTVAGFVTFELFPDQLARLFTDHAALLEPTSMGLRITGAAFFLVGAQIIISAFFQSIGMPGIAIFLSLSRQLLFLAPGLVLLPLWLGLDGVWVSLPLADALSFAVTVGILWRKTRKKKEEALAAARAASINETAPAMNEDEPVVNFSAQEGDTLTR